MTKRASAIAVPADYQFLHRYERSRYPLGWLTSGVDEDVVVQAVINRCRSLGAEVAVVDSGAKQLRGRAVGALMRAGRRDLLKHVNRGTTGVGESGLSDLIGTLPGGQALYLEVKRPEHLEPGVRARWRILREHGQPTDEQLRFLNRMWTAGACCGVVWSPDDAERVIRAPVDLGREVF